MSNLKELTLSLRSSLKSQSIKAKCKMDVSCGHETIRVDVPAYGVEFSKCEQIKIKKIAISMGFAWVKRMPIDINETTNPFNFVFYV